MSGEASKGFIPPHGRYAGLLADQKALIVFQGTVRFCERFLGKRDKTIHQMAQSARSAKQNICEQNGLLGQLIRKLRKDFLAEGGLRERVTRARPARRAKERGQSRRFLL
jgi:four helix bundle suffix protein